MISSDNKIEAEVPRGCVPIIVETPSGQGELVSVSGRGGRIVARLQSSGGLINCAAGECTVLDGHLRLQQLLAGKAVQG